MKEIYEILEKSTLFENISREEMNAILQDSNAKKININKNDYLFYQDDEPRYLYILIDGMVQIEKTDNNGKRMIMNRFYTSGDIFAEVYVYFKEKLYDYSCIAMKKSCVLAIKREFFLQNNKNLKEYSYKLTQNMLKILSCKALFLNQKILILSSFTLRQKISSYLLQRLREYEDRKTANLIFKREELADFLGTTRPSLSREMLMMQDEGIIKLDKNTFTVIDLEKLQSII